MRRPAASRAVARFPVASACAGADGSEAVHLARQTGLNLARGPGESTRTNGERDIAWRPALFISSKAIFLEMNMPRQNVQNPKHGKLARSIGLIHEAAALSWLGRWGSSSPTIISLLTNKQTPARILAAKLVTRGATWNTNAPHSFTLTLNRAGTARALALQEKIRRSNDLCDLATARGFAPLLLDPAPIARPRVAKVRHWTLAHDLKLQWFLVVTFRSQCWQALGISRPAAMRTTSELERIPRRLGQRIADFMVSQDDDNGRKFRVWIEFENSRKRADEIDRFVRGWADVIATSQWRLLVLCDTKNLLKEWRAAFDRREVVAYRPVGRGRFEKIMRQRRNEGGTLTKAPQMVPVADFDRSRLVVVQVKWDAVQALTKSPPPRA